MKTQGLFFTNTHLQICTCAVQNFSSVVKKLESECRSFFKTTGSGEAIKYAVLEFLNNLWGLGTE
jgi:hypothetical protein